MPSHRRCPTFGSLISAAHLPQGLCLTPRYVLFAPLATTSAAGTRGKGVGTGDFGTASVDDGDLDVAVPFAACCCSGDERSSLASADVVVVTLGVDAAAA